MRLAETGDEFGIVQGVETTLAIQTHQSVTLIVLPDND